MTAGELPAVQVESIRASAALPPRRPGRPRVRDARLTASGLSSLFGGSPFFLILDGSSRFPTADPPSRSRAPASTSRTSGSSFKLGALGFEAGERLEGFLEDLPLTITTPRSGSSSRDPAIDPWTSSAGEHQIVLSGTLNIPPDSPILSAPGDDLRVRLDAKTACRGQASRASASASIDLVLGPLTLAGRVVPGRTLGHDRPLLRREAREGC